MRIAIAGAGIAGLTAAAALARDGHTVEVYEQAPALGAVGAGLQLAPNAVRVLQRLGVELDGFAVRPAAIEMRRWSGGELIMSTALTGCTQRYGAPYLTVHRADLHEALLRQVPVGAVRLDARLVRIEETPSGVTLRLHDGRSARADLLIGADGIHSVVRERLVADRPRFCGQSIYRGLVPANRVPRLAADPRVRLWLGPDQHCVCYPVAGGRLISFGATVTQRPGAATRPAPGTTESWSADGDVDVMIKAYAGWHTEVLRLLSAADTVRRWALHDRDAAHRWSSAAVTLAGDAAHPMLPFLAQGANQAIEDAAALAVVLRNTAASDVDAALLRYETVRIARTSAVHARSRANSRALHLPDGPAQRERDAALGRGGDLSSQDWLYDYDAETAT